MQANDTILNLTVDKILIYYDLPQLFIARDQIGVKYVCLLIDSEDEEAEYISIPVSTKKLNELILGKIDLRTAFESSEIGVWYFAKYDGEEDFKITPVNFETINEEYLPDPDFYFPTIEENNSVIIEEAVERNNTVVHLSFADANNSNSMNIDLLGDFMKQFQSLIKYTYKKAIATSIKSRPDLASEKNYTLKAFATSPGSFNVHLESIANTDLFGNSNIEIALTRIDNIIGDISDENEIIESIKENKGHTVGAYKKILESIVKNNISITFKWVSASDNEVHLKRINKFYAEKAIDIISSREEFSKEIVEFIGVVKEVDADNNKWRILNAADNKPYAGKSDEVSLSGITVDQYVYKFICEEVVEIEKVTLKEKISYSLLSWTIVEE